MVRFAVVLVIATAATLAAQQPVFRSGTDLVTIGVTVSDRRGNIQQDLSQEHFEVVEDGVAQKVTYFARGGVEATAPELHVGLLFDTSGSMGQDISLARSAAVRFLNTLTDAVDITLVDFDTEVRVARYGQADFARIVERIRTRKPSGFTALYDALGVYLDAAHDAGGRTILVIFTDGGDTRSSLRFNELLTSLRASDITVYAVGFLENQGTGRLEQRLRIGQITETAGGESFYPTTMSQVGEAYDKILAQIRAQYSLGYVSSNPRRDGTWRKVEVRVRKSGLDRPKVQARKGYFAPYVR